MVSSSMIKDDSYFSSSEASSETSARDWGREGLLRELRREARYWLPSGKITDLFSIVSLISPDLKEGLVGGRYPETGMGT